MGYGEKGPMKTSVLNLILLAVGAFAATGLWIGDVWTSVEGGDEIILPTE